ncbi:YciI family protein [Pengzhenrongella sp.]|jgi:hypothetical protein|uniref:YciI family protein n=1 Tax=Pengzhenrongella sp. TaxID=2888820 RepID=UPI002F938690
MYGPIEGVPPMSEWAPGEGQAHFDALNALNRELTERGELVGLQFLDGPDTAKIVVADGAAPPVITDGPFPESKEFLAGYQIVDVANEERALEIAARVSAAPGPGGVPIRQPIQVRAVVGPD